MILKEQSPSPTCLRTAETYSRLNWNEPKPRMTAAEARAITKTHYLDRRAAAEYMNVSEKFLATHLHDGPKRLRVGSKVLYRLHDVENWMRQQVVAQ